MKSKSRRVGLGVFAGTILLTGSLIPSITLAAGSTASQLAEIKQQLDGVPITREETTFTAKVVGRDPDQLNIGDQIWYSFKSTEDCYVTLLVIDSEGTVTVSRPWDGELLQATQGDRLYPNPENLEAFVIEPPTGLEHIYTFCTCLLYTSDAADE